MNQVLTRLTAALSDRYRLERELGAGGMATVYLAQDLKHDRHVALKVLRPELAAVIGADRFLAEIKTTFPDRSSTRLVSRNGGTEPRWSRDGRELFFKSGGNLVAVTVPPGPVFTPSAPKVLFPVNAYRSASNRQQYDVSPDGKRFLMIRDFGGNASGSVVYVENWLDELKAKVKR